jgi:hypothetical protein
MTGGDSVERDLVEMFRFEHPSTRNGKAVARKPRQPRPFTTQGARGVDESLATVPVDRAQETK